MKIVLRKRDILVTCIVIIGLIFWTSAIWEYYHIKTAQPLETLSSQDIQKGKYVKGTVKEYCGFMLESGAFVGESVCVVGFSENLNYYTIKLCDGSYITLMAKYEKTRRMLKQYESGIGNDVYIEGVITSPVLELNYPWLQRALQKNSQEEVEALVSSQYAIKERDFPKIGMRMVYGLSFMLMAVIIILADLLENKLYTLGGIKDGESL